MEADLCEMTTGDSWRWVAPVEPVVVVRLLIVPQLHYSRVIDVVVDVASPGCPDVHILSVGPVFWVMLQGVVGENLSNLRS